MTLSILARLDTFGEELSLVLDFTPTDLAPVVVHYVAPDGTTGTWSASYSASPVPRVIYTTQSGDLDQVGVYTLTPKIGWRYSSPVVLRVYD